MQQLGLPELIIILVLGFFIFVWWRLVAKTGLPGALSLLFVVPVINVVFVFYLAFAEWPVERELKLLRQQSDRNSV